MDEGVEDVEMERARGNRELATKGAFSYWCAVPRKVRDLIKDLRKAGFEPVAGAGRGSHRKFFHANFPGAVTLSGKDNADAKSYQEKAIKKAVEAVES